jgi:hypothetical protein
MAPLGGVVPVAERATDERTAERAGTTGVVGVVAAALAGGVARVVLVP